MRAAPIPAKRPAALLGTADDATVGGMMGCKLSRDPRLPRGKIGTPMALRTGKLGGGGNADNVRRR